MSFKRYAVYYTPPCGALADFGAKWLGWDIWAGRAVPHPTVAGLPKPAASITARPRRYGFHATLKPPFRLAAGFTEACLQDAMHTMCAKIAPVAIQAMELRQIGSFLALTPVGDTGPVDQLAAAMVRGLDRFRARPDEAELEQRRRAGLDPQQEALLQQWGYPYVLDAFRFHMTLSGPMGRTELAALRPALAPILLRLLPGSLRISDVTLVGEDPSGRFHGLHRYALSGKASPCPNAAKPPPTASR